MGPAVKMHGFVLQTSSYEQYTTANRQVVQY